MTTPPTYLVTVGASAGGVQVVQRLVASMDPAMDAAICVVLHIHPTAESAMHQAISRWSGWQAQLVDDGTAIERGHIYVARPDHHLVVDDACVHLVKGPRENHVRPAIDPLFRSAAVAWRSRAIGVLASGMLDDGTAGLQAIARCGGTTIVQNPEEAAYGDMPRSAIHFVDVDHVVGVEAMAPLLQELSSRIPADPPPVPSELELESHIDLQGRSSAHREEALGEQVPLGCPDCGGPLWELGEKPRRYRCHTGHAYTRQALLDSQHKEAERAIWVAIRVLEERRRVLERAMSDLPDQDGSRLLEVKQQIRVLRALAAGELTAERAG